MLILQRNLNILFILIVSGVLLSAYGVQFIFHEQPCPLCMLQRLGMIGASFGAALNLWFGIRMSHYGLMLISSLYGGGVALRQISLHVCPGFPTFGIPVLGLSLYTWSFVVFVCIVAYVALLLILFDCTEKKEVSAPINGWSSFSVVSIFSITLANVITTFLQCGWGPCVD